MQAFWLILLAELGDKTLLITIKVAAENSALLVLADLTFALLTVIAALIGVKFVVRLSMRWLKVGVSVLFVVLGLSLVSAAFGFSLLWLGK